MAGDIVGAAELIAERIAKNQSTFRDANERIETAAEELGEDDLSVVPFICECPDRRCTAIAKLQLAAYEMVRADGAWFLVFPGHETCVVDGVEVAAVLKRFVNYSVMEKVGRAGEIARELDSRSQ